MERKQFTFYRSFWDSIKNLPRKEQGNILISICSYALDDSIPENQSAVAETVFTLIRPNLDASRRKAESGQRGGHREANEKQDESKPEANDKQTASEKEKEKEGEIEIENECYTPITPFDAFWKAYPKKVGKEAARKSFAKLSKTIYPLLVPAVEEQKKSAQWKKDGGQFIPNPTTWLNQGRWQDEPPDQMPETDNVFARLVQEGAFDDDP